MTLVHARGPGRAFPRRTPGLRRMSSRRSASRWSKDGTPGMGTTLRRRSLSRRLRPRLGAQVRVDVTQRDRAARHTRRGHPECSPLDGNSLEECLAARVLGSLRQDRCEVGVESAGSAVELVCPPDRVTVPMRVVVQHPPSLGDRRGRGRGFEHHGEASAKSPGRKAPVGYRSQASKVRSHGHGPVLAVTVLAT